MSDAYAIYVCLSCGRQSRGPGAHHVAGDDCCSGCAVAKGQPRLARIEVRIADEGTSAHLARARRLAAEAEQARRLERELVAAS